MGGQRSGEIGQPSLRERQRAEREVLILHEAERLLREESYEGLVMERLAERVGVSKGTLYQHFAKKEDLVGAVFMRGLTRVGEQLTAYVADSGRPVVERLGAFLTTLIEGDLAWMSSISGPQKHEIVAALVDHADLQEARERFFAELSTLIRQGQTSRELDAAIPAPIAARFLLSLVIAQGGPGLPGDAAEDCREFAALAVRFYFHGLCAQPTP